MTDDPTATLQALAGHYRLAAAAWARHPDNPAGMYLALAEHVELVKGLIGHDFEHPDLPVIVASLLAVAAAAGIITPTTKT